MNGITQHYIVDLSSNNNFVQIPAMQGDGQNSRYVEIELIENGQQYIVDSDNFVTITGTKPDGYEIWNVCDVDSHGYIIVELTYQMTIAAGRGKYSIAIFDTATNNQLKSFPFFVLVTEATYDPGFIMSSNEFEALEQYTTAAVKAAEAAEKSAQDAALAGTIGVMHINSTTGHLIFEKVDSWRGNFEIVSDPDLGTTGRTNLIVHWE